MSNLLNLPQLHGAQFLDVPGEFRNFGNKHLVGEIYLVDAPLLKHSLRSHQDVLVNLRCTFWTSLIEPPFGAQTYYEAIVLRFLHEIGHRVHEHSANAQLDAAGNVVVEKGDYFQKALDGLEGEAWTFAFEVRRNEPTIYADLIKAIKSKLSNHNFENMDWEENASEQFKRINGISDKVAEFRMPAWVRSRCGKYFVRQYKLRIV